MELLRFSYASEEAYAGVVYLRMTDSLQQVHTSLVTSKTKVAPIKHLTIPRLELCGAHLLAQLLHHVKQVLRLPIDKVHTCTESTIVLSWLVGNPCQFKTYVGNRISYIIELIPPDRWTYVTSADNPADCASRGLFLSELLEHKLWWNGPDWLKLPSSFWPQLSGVTLAQRQICHHAVMGQDTPVIDMNRYSNLTHLK